MATTNHVCAKQVRNLINAHLFAERQDMPLTARVTIRWEDTIGWRPDRLVPRMQKLTERLSKWCHRKHDIPLAYTWVAENPPPRTRTRNRGHHVHMGMHCPNRLIPNLISMFDGWVDGFVPRRYITLFSSNQKMFLPQGVAPQFLWKETQRRGKLKYQIKGCSVQVANALALNRVSEGRIIGKRVGISLSLGPTARSKAGFSDLCTWNELRHITSS